MSGTAIIAMSPDRTNLPLYRPQSSCRLSGFIYLNTNLADLDLDRGCRPSSAPRTWVELLLLALEMARASLSCSLSGCIASAVARTFVQSTFEVNGTGNHCHFSSSVAESQPELMTFALH